MKSIREHMLLMFFLLSFLLSWIIWVPLLLDHFKIVPLNLSPGIVLIGRLFGTLGPATAAILVSFQRGGMDSVRRLLGQLKKWPIGWAWYAAAVIVYPSLVFVTAELYLLLPHAQNLPFQSASLGTVLVTSIFMVISVLGEEIGWRGFALPLMQDNWRALKSSLILGTVWTVWHLPFWALLDELALYGWWYWLLGWAFISSGSIYITWLMNNTYNSLFLVVLFHWSYNILSVVYFPITTVVPAYVIFIALSWVVAISLVIRYGANELGKKDTRKRYSHTLSILSVGVGFMVGGSAPPSECSAQRGSSPAPREASW